MGISIPLIYFFVNRTIEIDILPFRSEILENNSKPSGFYSSKFQKIDNFIQTEELNRNKSFVIKSNILGKYDYFDGNKIIGITKTVNNKRLEEKVINGLKNIPQDAISYDFERIYDIVNLYINIKPKNNISKLIRYISEYYQKDKKLFKYKLEPPKEYNPIFRDLNFLVSYFKLNNLNFEKYFEIKNWIKKSLQELDFKSDEIIPEINEDPIITSKKQTLLFIKYSPILSLISLLGKDFFADIIKEKQESIIFLIKSWDNVFTKSLKNGSVWDLDHPAIPGVISFYLVSKNFYDYPNQDWIAKMNAIKKWFLDFDKNRDLAFYVWPIINYYFYNKNNLDFEITKKTEDLVNYNFDYQLFPNKPDISQTIFLYQIFDSENKKNNINSKLKPTIEDYFNKTLKQAQNYDDFFLDLYNFVFFKVRYDSNFFILNNDFLENILSYAKFVKNPVDFFYFFKTVALLSAFLDTKTKITISEAVANNVINAKLEKNSPFLFKFINLFLKFIVKNEFINDKEIVDYLNANLEVKNIKNPQFFELLFLYLEFIKSIKIISENKLDYKKLENFILGIKNEIFQEISKKSGKTPFLNIKTIYLAYQIDWLVKNGTN